MDEDMDWDASETLDSIMNSFKFPLRTGKIERKDNHYVMIWGEGDSKRESEDTILWLDDGENSLVIVTSGVDRYRYFTVHYLDLRDKSWKHAMDFSGDTKFGPAKEMAASLSWAMNATLGYSTALRKKESEEAENRHRQELQEERNRVLAQAIEALENLKTK